VAAFATQHATERVKTFSIGFEEDSFDESKFARQVAKHLGTEHYEDRLSAEKAGDLIGDIGRWLDEPLSDGSLIPTYLLARFVRQHVTVALGGDGGDELFAGYPMYYAHKVAGYYKAIPSFVRRGVVALFASVVLIGCALLWWIGIDGAGWHGLIQSLLAVAILCAFFARDAKRPA